MQFEGVYTKVEQGRLKDEFIQSLQKSTAENPIHCNFFELGGKVLQAIQSPNIVNFSKIERTASNVFVYAAVSDGQSLPKYLASQSSISDEHFSQIIDQLIAGVSAVHSQGFYHQALNPTSFWVNEKGTIQLSLFETLEMRFCQQNPELLQSNESLHVINRFLSPERQKDPKTVAFSDEYYSVGLIAWYIWCLKVGRITPNSDIQSLPNFEVTGTPWDRLWNSCLNSNPANRPNSVVQFQALISEIKPELKKIVEIEEPSENEVEKENEQTSSEIQVVFYNFSTDDYQIWCNKRPITNLFQKLQGTKLTVSMPEGALIEIYTNNNGNLLDSFNTSKQSTYKLPEITTNNIENSKKKSSSNATTVGLILGGIIIFLGILIYLKFDQKPPSKPIESIDGPAFAMVPPDGYTIVDTNNNNLLRKTGFVVDGTKWRYKKGNWEKFVPDGSEGKEKWVIDNSLKAKLLQTYFEKIEVIESEGELPDNYELIKGNDSILYQNGKEALDGNFYRFVNNRWYKKDGESWKKLLSFEDYKDVLETYFVHKDLLQQIDDNDYGYVQGEKVRYRSEPSDRNYKTVLGYFKNYKIYPDGSPLEIYINTNPDYVYYISEKNDWYLVIISENSKIVWMSKRQFVPQPPLD